MLIKISDKGIKKLDNRCLLGTLCICQSAPSVTKNENLKIVCRKIVLYFEKYQCTSEKLMEKIKIKKERTIKAGFLVQGGTKIDEEINESLSKINDSFNEILMQVLIDAVMPILDKLVELDNNTVNKLVNEIDYISNNFSEKGITELKNKINDYENNVKKVIDACIRSTNLVSLDVIVNYNLKFAFDIVMLSSRIERYTNNCKYKERIDNYLEFISNKLVDEVNEVTQDALNTCNEFRERALNVIDTKIKELYLLNSKTNEKIKYKVDCVEKIKIEKTYEYKALNKLAVESGYKFDRQNGDHAQFVNSNGKCVTIPQGRLIGKGLSIKIQKQLRC